MAAEGVNTASLGNADQGSGFSRQRTSNIQHPTSNAPGDCLAFGVRCSMFDVRCSMLKKNTPLLHHSITLSCVTNTTREDSRRFCARQVNSVSGKILTL